MDVNTGARMPCLNIAVNGGYADYLPLFSSPEMAELLVLTYETFVDSVGAEAAKEWLRDAQTRRRNLKDAR